MRVKLLALLLAALLTLGLAVPAGAAEAEEVTILYTNDIHTYITEDLTYSLIAAYKDSLGDALLVDAGDHIQGTAYGSMDSGETITRLMNAAGYDAATLGNHEFDYGMAGCLDAVSRADFPYVSCNFYHEQEGVRGENVLPAYTVLETRGVKIAFVGITTPETFTATSPAYFKDGDGNYIYGIAGGAEGSGLYAAAQQAIDAASAEADYVIALGHLGTDPTSGAWTSEKLIANTTGLDAFIDAHSHSSIPSRTVADKDGAPVLLTQSGSYFGALGEMTITADSSISTRLLTAEDLAHITPDPEIAAIEAAWTADIDARLGEKIAASAIDFTISYADGSRAVRRESCSMAELNADAYYWYINEREGLDCDFALTNGGGVRDSVPAGDWTYNSCKTVNPFGNVLCIIRLSGQDILDALEFGARSVGEAECGGLLHAAGLVYSVNTAIPSTVQMNDKGEWSGGPEAYRVHDVKIYDKASGSYLPLEPERMYTVAGSNFTLRGCGDGYTMMAAGELVKDYISEDYLAFAAYLQAFTDADGDGWADIASGGSPLAAYPGYLLSYEIPTGSQRLAVVKAAEDKTATYIVTPGDTLWRIAKKLYGSGSLWNDIYNANTTVIKNPNLIYIGQELMIP